MHRTARAIAALIFVAIAAFLVAWTRLPALEGLKEEEGKVGAIAPAANAWHEVEILTASGIRLTCRAKRDWPLIGPSRCPLEKFERHRGQPLMVRHDGRTPYSAVAGKEALIDYAAHQRLRMIGAALAAGMLFLAYRAWNWPGER